MNISDPFRPNEVGYYIPAGCNGKPTPQSNDVFVDGRGLIYLSDRWGYGLESWNIPDPAEPIYFGAFWINDGRNSKIY